MLKKFFKAWFVFLFVTLYCYVASESVLDYVETNNWNATCKSGEEVKLNYEFIWAGTIRNLKRIRELW